MAPKNKHDLLAAMVNHSGKDKSINATDLADKLGVTERQLRDFVTECRKDGYAICAHPSSGYFMARTQEEIEETIAFLKHRALTSLELVATLQKRPMADVLGQLHINA